MLIRSYQRLKTLQKQQSRIGQGFLRDERGSMVVFCLFMFMMMLVLGGMAVDFMRAESRRATIQGVSDRAVLAAASLRHSRAPESVAIDYFKKAGHIDDIVGSPNVNESADSKTILLQTSSVINTYFLQFLNVETSSSTTKTTAIDKENNIEVSLVLDGYYLDPLEIEGTNHFAEKLFETKNGDNISLSFVPFASSVNLGEDLANELGSTPPLNKSNCMSVGDLDYSTIGINTAKGYKRDQQIDVETASGGGIKTPICPKDTGIIALTNDLGDISDRLNDIKVSLATKPKTGPAIHTGLKWGAALLDPSMRDPLNEVGHDSLFPGRPLKFDIKTNHKVMVLVNGDNIADIQRFNAEAYGKTIGDLFKGNTVLLDLIKGEYDLDPEDTVSKLLEENNIQTLGQYFGGILVNLTEKWIDGPITPEEDDAITLLNGEIIDFFPSQASDLETLNEAGDVQDNIKSVCQAAKDKGIIIYVVNYHADFPTRDALSSCASSPNHYFQTELGSLETVMNAVALHISNLRLSL